MISTKTVSIRTADLDDVEFIKHCMDGGEKEEYIIPVPSTIPVEERIRSRLFEAQYRIPDLQEDYSIVFRYYVAEFEDKKVGLLITATHSGPYHAPWHEYHFLYVVPEFRQHHIGSRLLYHAAIEDLVRGTKEMVVRCLVKNGTKSRAHFYFEKLGFVDIAAGSPLGAATILETTPMALLTSLANGGVQSVQRKTIAA